MKIETPAMVTCPQCHSAKLAHRACPTCGYYAGREAVKVKSPKKKTT
jgi:large subunit ribosomal protein L32